MTIPPFTEKRETLAQALQQLGASGLSPGHSGNASVRVESGMLISPTGLAAADCLPDKLVFIDHHGFCPDNQLRPSSEWHFHLALYTAYAATGAIVHCHSRYATTLACRRLEIPAYHYMVAIAGGDTIPCAEYATFGTRALATAVVKALANRKACLMANHGQIACGDDIAQALDLAVQVEDLAAGYYQTLLLGGPVLLDEAQMREVLDKFPHYGQQD